MRNKYLSDPNYNFEKVNRASLACGPMVKWAIAQVRVLGVPTEPWLFSILALIVLLFHQRLKLMIWSIYFTASQINYSDMLNKVEPLRNELQALEDEAQENRKKNEEIQKLIEELERSIARYKEEYAVLISQAQAIKADLLAVEAKVMNVLIEVLLEPWINKVLYVQLILAGRFE